MSETGAVKDPKESDEVTATLYIALQSLTIHSQENKTFTLYNFLLFNSFLLMGWATLFSQQQQWIEALAASILCIVGVVVAAAWKPLMKDYARASDLFRHDLATVETFLPTRWPRPISGRDKQIVERDKQARKSLVGDRDLLTFAPNLFMWVYFALLGLSVAKQFVPIQRYVAV